MVREIDTNKCPAWIMMGEKTAGAILPCKSWGEGRCLKDRRREAGVPNVSVFEGICIADLKDGIDDPQSSAPLIQEIRESGNTAINTALDLLLMEQQKRAENN